MEQNKKGINEAPENITR